MCKCERISTILYKRILLNKSKKKLRARLGSKRLDRGRPCFNRNDFESLILAQDERWRRA